MDSYDHGIRFEALRGADSVGTMTGLPDRDMGEGSKPNDHSHSPD